MLTKFIYICPIVIALFGLLSIYFALINKKRSDNTCIFVYDVINMVYLFYISLVSYNVFPIYIELNIVYTWAFAGVGGVFYLISLIICLLKNKKARVEARSKINPIILIILMFIPGLLFGGLSLYEQMILDSAEILIKGETGEGFGAKDFTLVINNYNVFESSIDIEDSYNNHKYFKLPVNVKKVTYEELVNMGREIILDGHYLRYLKDGEEVYRIKIKYDEYDNFEIYYFIK